MMVVYHVGYDVDQFGPSVDIDPFSGGWRALQLACGSTFLFVVGVSLAISNARGRARGVAGWPLYRRHLRRAGQVAAAALLVTLVTWIALGDDYVRFGILHCIAVAMVIGPLLLPLGRGEPGARLRRPGRRHGPAAGAESDVPGLLVLGVPPEGGAGVDWYPLLPWLAPAWWASPWAGPSTPAASAAGGAAACRPRPGPGPSARPAATPCRSTWCTSRS